MSTQGTTGNSRPAEMIIRGPAPIGGRWVPIPQEGPHSRRTLPVLSGQRMIVLRKSTGPGSTSLDGDHPPLITRPGSAWGKIVCPPITPNPAWPALSTQLSESSHQELPQTDVDESAFEAEGVEREVEPVVRSVSFGAAPDQMIPVRETSKEAPPPPSVWKAMSIGASNLPQNSSQRWPTPAEGSQTTSLDRLPLQIAGLSFHNRDRAPESPPGDLRMQISPTQRQKPMVLPCVSPWKLLPAVTPAAISSKCGTTATDVEELSPPSPHSTEKPKAALAEVDGPISPIERQQQIPLPPASSWKAVPPPFHLEFKDWSIPENWLRKDSPQNPSFPLVCHAAPMAPPSKKGSARHKVVPSTKQKIPLEVLCMTEAVPIKPLGEKWRWPSDHLPVAAKVDEFYVVTWNVLNSMYIEEFVVKQNTQGLKGSLITQENKYVKDKGMLTERDQHIIKIVISMIKHPTHPKDVIALQEVSDAMLNELDSLVPPRMKLLRNYENPDSDQRVLLYNTKIFTHIEKLSKKDVRVFSPPKGVRPLADPKPVMQIVLEHKDSKKRYCFLNAHVPGNPDYKADEQFAKYVYQQKKAFSKVGVTVVALGDMNVQGPHMTELLQKEREQASAQRGALSETDDFERFSGYRGNIGPAEHGPMCAKAVDHIFVSGLHGVRAFPVAPADVCPSPYQTWIGHALRLFHDNAIKESS